MVGAFLFGILRVFCHIFPMIIQVDHLSKHFSVHHKEPGMWGALKSIAIRKYVSVPAVNDVSFTINEGELVGFIGPNGAGKTTTLKCLSGLLYPTNGSVTVLGYTPFERKYDFLRKISLVMGQKNQLWWDLPAQETFLLHKEIYSIPDDVYKKTLSELVELLDVSNVLTVQVRKLSLGERMRMELITSLLHSPKVFFLDEPTIGLDVVMQKRLRDFISQYNKRFNATILLTSHYMEDVKQLAQRVIVIDHGAIMFDGKLSELVTRYAKHKLISFSLDREFSRPAFRGLGDIVQFDLPKIVLKTKREESNAVAARLLESFPISDITIEEPTTEDIIRDLFSSIHK